MRIERLLADSKHEKIAKSNLNLYFTFVASSLPTTLFSNPFPERKIEAMTLTTYLNYGGNCREALSFYEAHLGGRILSISTHGDMPGARDLTPEQAKAVMHARIQIGGVTLMASDVPTDRFQPMRSVYLALGLESDEEAERIYAVLSDGAEIFMKMEETFFAHRFAMLRDKFGTSWMIIHEKPMPRAA